MSAPTPDRPRTSGPAEGDRVEVRITGTVLARHSDGMRHIELDADLISGGDGQPVTTFETHDRVTLLGGDAR